VTRHFAYPAGALLADYARGSGGLFMVAAAVFVPMHRAVALVCLTIAAPLLVFGLRTLLRQMSRVELSETGIVIAGPWPRRIAWTELTRFRLRYFALRRDRKHGWMQLTLTGGRTSLSIESQIDGFAAIVERAVQAAAGLEIDEASLVNLGAMGIAPPRHSTIAE
jgi:hypothetical protein